jgi:para-nitrobenzyl esterase
MQDMTNPPPGRPAPETSEVSEDCLYLNVCRPAGDAVLPVLVWLHGGGFAVGSGADVIGDGAGFAVSCDVVVVTVNFRLGAFGFLHLAELAGDTFAGAGNTGLLDQVAALEWVRDNIAAFGGDPERVTLMGVSAGAKSVGTLLGTPAARGLFHRAISMSGGADTVYTAAEATEVTRALLAGLDGRRETLRSVPAEVLLQAQRRLAQGIPATWLWRPVVDGTVLPEPPLEAIRAGNSRGVPVLAGTTRFEARFFTAIDPACLGGVRAVLRGSHGDRAGEVLAAYGLGAGRGQEDALSDVMTHERYWIPTIRLAEAMQEHASVWMYRYDWRSPSLGRLGAAHASDVSVVWGLTTDPADRPVVAMVQQAWREFIHEKPPAADRMPTWEPYQLPQRATMQLDASAYLAHDPDAAQRSVWESARVAYPAWPASAE